MKCIKCGREGVISTQHGTSCELCFERYIENKVSKTISQNKLIERGQRVGVAVSGGKDSLTTLYLVHKFMTKHNLGVPIVITLDVGTPNYKDNIANVKKMCLELDVEPVIVKYKDYYGKSLPEFMKIRDSREMKIHSCAFCGTLKRQLINKTAKEQKLDVLITGHNLDDESQSFIMNIFKGNKDIMFRQSIKTNPTKDTFVRRVKPLYYITNEETKQYTKIKGFSVDYRPCPYSEESYREDVKIILNNMDKKYPGTKNSIINSFEFIGSKIDYKTDEKNIGRCKVCGEPSKGEICKACTLLEEME